MMAPLSTVCLGQIGTNKKSAEGLSIAAVERETGISKDSLRVWERRYGFPIPTRNAFGERVYPAAQVGRLRMIRRLIGQGMRPGRIFALPPGELQALAAGPPAAARSTLHDLSLYLIKTHQSTELRRELEQAVVRDGLFRFVTETAAPLAALVGEAWMRGEIEVFEEHLFTEQMQGPPAPGDRAGAHRRGGAQGAAIDLAGRAARPGPAAGRGRVRARGRACISLGIQTPLANWSPRRAPTPPTWWRFHSAAATRPAPCARACRCCAGICRRPRRCGAEAQVPRACAIRRPACWCLNVSARSAARC